MARKTLFGGSIGIGVLVIALAIVIISNVDSFENDNIQNNTIQDDVDYTSPLTALINYRAIGKSR